MGKILWTKYKIGLRHNTLFNLISLFFLVGAMIETIFAKDGDYSMMQFVYLYIPLHLNTTMNCMEISKCNYLVPRSATERKQFLVIQNVFKFIVALIMIVLLSFVLTLLNPSTLQYNLLGMMIFGLPGALIMLPNGVCCYRQEKSKRKRRKQAGETNFFKSIIAAAGLLSVYGLVLDLLKKQMFGYCYLFGGLLNVICLIYSVIKYIKFSRIETSYEHVDFDFVKMNTRNQSIIG